MSICVIPCASCAIRQQEIGTIIHGSKLAPRFFDIYSNDMHSVLAGNEFVMSADDSAAVYVADDLDELANYVSFVKLVVGKVGVVSFKIAINPNKC